MEQKGFVKAWADYDKYGDEVLEELTGTTMIEGKYEKTVPFFRENYEDFKIIINSATLPYIYYTNAAEFDIIMEEAQAYFAGNRTAEETASIIQVRVNLYLSEQS